MGVAVRVTSVPAAAEVLSAMAVPLPSVLTLTLYIEIDAVSVCLHLVQIRLCVVPSLLGIQLPKVCASMLRPPSPALHS